MGKNNSKWNDWQRINFQNIQAAHTTQYQKNKQPNKKVGKRSKQTFFKEDIQMGNKHMKRYSTSLIIREMKIRTTEISPHTRQNGHHQKIYKQQVLERVWRKGTLLHAGGNVNSYNHYGRQYGVSFIKLETKPPCDPAIPLLGIHPEETKTEKDTCTPMFTAALL